MAGKRKIVRSCVEDWLEILARVLGPFSLNPDNFSRCKSAFMYPAFAFKTKISILLNNKNNSKKTNLTSL